MSEESRSRSPAEQGIHDLGIDAHGVALEATGELGSSSPNPAVRGVSKALGRYGSLAATTLDVAVSVATGRSINQQQVEAAALGWGVGGIVGIAASGFVAGFFAPAFAATFAAGALAFTVGTVAGLVAGSFAEGWVNSARCFPADTKVRLLERECHISQLREGDWVVSFSPYGANIDTELCRKRVIRIHHNVTKEWIKLTWTENGQYKELVTTPGHHFLNQFGQFRTIDAMIQNGRATVVLASGELAEVSAERIVWSAETADMFERAHTAPVTLGNLALKPEPVDSWQTYNFEVEEFHTYVAGGARVHNESGFLGAIGNTIDSALNAFGPVGGNAMLT